MSSSKVEVEFWWVVDGGWWVVDGGRMIKGNL